MPVSWSITTVLCKFIVFAIRRRRIRVSVSRPFGFPLLPARALSLPLLPRMMSAGRETRKWQRRTPMKPSMCPALGLLALPQVAAAQAPLTDTRNWASGCSSRQILRYAHQADPGEQGSMARRCPRKPPAAAPTWSATSSATALRACRASNTPMMRVDSPPSPTISRSCRCPPPRLPRPGRRARRATTIRNQEKTPWQTHDASPVPASSPSRSRPAPSPHLLRLPLRGPPMRCSADRRLGRRRDDGRRHGLRQGRGLDDHDHRLHRRQRQFSSPPLPEGKSTCGRRR